MGALTIFWLAVQGDTLGEWCAMSGPFSSREEAESMRGKLESTVLAASLVVVETRVAVVAFY